MKRRDFLHKSIHASAGATLFGNLPAMLPSRLQMVGNANPENDRVLVAIFLNGGNDSLNTIVQLDDLSTLSGLRPHVFLPESSLIHLPDHPLGLHPALSGLSQLYSEGLLRIVRGVGYENQNFSHFRSSDIWMSGSDADDIVASGWMGRYLDQTYPGYPNGFPNSSHPHPLAIEIGYSNSLLFQAPVANMSVVLNGERDFYSLVEDNVDPTPSTLAGEQLAHVKLVRRQSQQYGTAIRDASNKVSSQVDYPQSHLAGQLRIVARMIAGGLQTPMYKVELGGFDTHAGQVDPSDTTQGVHAYLLRELDEAIVAFMADLKHLGIEDRVLGMTFSEFGRRIVSNGSLGTDHGSAGPLFLFGTGVQNGVLGENYVLDSGMTYEDNLPWQYDFRHVYGSVLEQWLCVSAADVDQALLGKFSSIPLIDPAVCQSTSVHDPRTDAIKHYLSVSPNPLNGVAQLEFESHGDHLQVDLLDTSGRIIRPILAGKYPAGTHQHRFSTSYLPAGHYFVRISSKDFRQAKPVVKM